MKYLRCSILILLLFFSTSVYAINSNQDKPLSIVELKEMFPDNNFRQVVRNHYKNENITINKLKSFDDELYASGENICNLSGISYLENVESITLWNNNLTELPKEITKLKKLKRIDVRNNYITDDTVIKDLINNKVNVNSDLNFISNYNYQYSLKPKSDTVSLKKNETLNVYDLIEKEIDTYPKDWEISTSISKNLDLKVNSSNEDILSIKDNNTVKGIKEGYARLKIFWPDEHNDNSFTVIKFKVV